MREKEKQAMSRRDFAKASAAAASFAILSSKAGRAETNSETLKAGVIGCGGRGGGAVINFLQENENVKLTGMADVFEDQLKGCLRKFKDHTKVDVNPDMCFVGLDAYKELLKTDVDIIIHATTPYIRPVHIEAAVNAGKHIFTEKPVAVDPVGIRRFIAAAEKAEQKKLSFVCGTQRRHDPRYVDTVKRIQDGEIGELIAARAYWCGGLPHARKRKEGWSDLEYRLRNWYNQCWTCGENIVEQHIHNLDVINWIMGGPPKRVYASGGRAWKPREEKYGDIWDQFSCDYEYDNGVHCISMSRHWPGGCTGGVFEEVLGTKKRSRCADLGGDKADPYVEEHNHLVASIRGTGPYLNEGVRTAESTMTAMMGRMSAYTGKELSWRKAMKSDLSIVPQDLDFAKPYPLGPIPVPGD